MKPPDAETLLALAELLADRHRFADARYYCRLSEAATKIGTRPEWALAYARAGHPVFPLGDWAKIPRPGSHGLTDATTDLEIVEAWWGRWPNANVGLATGHTVDVVDIDGPEGVRWWAQLEVDDPTREVEPGVPILGTANTPRGSHLYIPAQGWRNAAGLAPQVDYRGLGGYVVAPPSVISGHGYTWRSGGLL